MNRIFTLAAIALAERDSLLLKSLCRLSLGRANVYTFAKDGVAPEIYVVDGDDGESLTQWKAASVNHPAPTMFISRDGESVLQPYFAQRPLIASRLLALLDKITAKELAAVAD